jgi:hypothetical protein
VLLPQIRYLQLATLILRADACIDSDSHNSGQRSGERNQLFFAHSPFPTPSTTMNIRI